MEMFNLGMTWGEAALWAGAAALWLLAFCAAMAVFGGEDE